MRVIENYIIKCLLEENIILEQDIDYWSYRLQIMEGKCIHILILIISLLLSGNRLSFAIYAVALYMIRTVSGGYHADSKAKCIIMSIVWYEMVNFLILPFTLEGRLSVIMLILLIISIVVIAVWAPVNHPNLDLNNEEYHSLKRLVIIVLIVEIIAAYVFKMINVDGYYAVELALISCAVLIIVSKLLKQEVKIYEED